MSVNVLNMKRIFGETTKTLLLQFSQTYPSPLYQNPSGSRQKDSLCAWAWSKQSQYCIECLLAQQSLTIPVRHAFTSLFTLIRSKWDVCCLPFLLFMLMLILFSTRSQGSYRSWTLFAICPNLPLLAFIISSIRTISRNHQRWAGWTKGESVRSSEYTRAATTFQTQYAGTRSPCKWWEPTKSKRYLGVST